MVIQGPKHVSSHGSAIPWRLRDLCVQEEGEREEVTHPLLNCFGQKWHTSHLLTLYWPIPVTRPCTNERHWERYCLPGQPCFSHNSSAWEGEHEIFDKKLVISALVSMSISSFYPIGSMVTWFNLSGIHGNLMRVKVLSIGQCSCEKWSRQKMSVVSVFCGLMFSASEKWVSGSFFRTLISVVHCRILTAGQHGLQRWQPCLDYMSHCRERYPKMWFLHTV